MRDLRSISFADSFLIFTSRMTSSGSLSWHVCTIKVYRRLFEQRTASRSRNILFEELHRKQRKFWIRHGSNASCRSQASVKKCFPSFYYTCQPLLFRPAFPMLKGTVPFMLRVMNGLSRLGRSWNKRSFRNELLFVNTAPVSWPFWIWSDRKFSANFAVVQTCNIWIPTMSVLCRVWASVVLQWLCRSVMSVRKSQSCCGSVLPGKVWATGIVINEYFERDERRTRKSMKWNKSSFVEPTFFSLFNETVDRMAAQLYK